MTIDKYDWISFDLFDTLIKRNVLKTTDIFKIVQKRYNTKSGQKIKDFVDVRVELEHKVRELSDSEITIYDIYREISAYYGESIGNELKRLEIEAEIEFCCPNQSIMQIYNKCIVDKKKVLIITDMYLDKETICKMLNKCGYNQYNKLYISSEAKVTKVSGELFKVIKKELQISNKEWIHIGDNIKSDYIQPLKLGISAKHISTQENKLSYFNLPQKSNLSESILAATLNNYVNEELSVWRRFGAECMAPILIGFTNWLSSEINRKNIKKIYFFSRDGYILQQAYDLTKPHNLESRYLYVSRRALQVPAFYIDAEYETVVTSFFLPRTFTFGIFIEKLGLNYEQIVDIAKKHHYMKNTIIEYKEIISNKQLRSLYEDIKGLVIANSEKEYKGLVAYLKQNAFEGKVAIVDIGWFGHMQKALDKVVKQSGIDVEIFGYYVGLNPKGKIQNELHMKGYLFSNAHNQEIYPKERIFNSIFETLFLGKHGSVKKYRNNNGEIEVELYPYECQESQMENDIRAIQEAAVEFLKYWYVIKDNVELEVTPKFVFSALCQIGVAPNVEWAEKLGDWKFFDIENRYIAKGDGIKEYIFKPKKFIQDLNNAGWKVGFLKRVFKIKLPYYSIWMSIRHLYKKGEKENG